MTFEEYVLISLDTAEVEFFNSREQAKEFIKDNALNNKKHLIMPCVEVTDKEQVELVIYPNADHNSIMGSVAEYQEDVLNSDFISSPNTPVKYMQAYNYEEN